MSLCSPDVLRNLLLRYRQLVRKTMHARSPHVKTQYGFNVPIHKHHIPNHTETINVIVHEDVHLKRTEPNFLNWTFQELCTHGSCFIMRTLAGVKDRAETSNYTPRCLSVVITFPAFIPASGTQFLKLCGVWYWWNLPILLGFTSLDLE